MDSPCESCRHRYAELVMIDKWSGRQYEDDCEESAPNGVFMSEWGCYMYEERVDADE